MQQSRAQIEDARLEGERRLKYKGTTRINLAVLGFPQSQTRKSNKKRVEFLVGCF